MVKLLTLCLFLELFLVSSTYAENSSSINSNGDVIWEGEECDYYIIETSRWYVLVELYRGRLHEGDEVSGDLHSYSFKYLKNISRGDSEIKVWIENYWSSKDDCFSWLRENSKCGLSPG